MSSYYIVWNFLSSQLKTLMYPSEIPVAWQASLVKENDSEYVSVLFLLRFLQDSYPEVGEIKLRDMETGKE